MTTTPAATDRPALEAEVARLQAKLRARKDQPGFAANVAELRARIAELQAQLAQP